MATLDEEYGAQVFKLVAAVAKAWRGLMDENQLPKGVKGITFRASVAVTKMLA